MLVSLRSLWGGRTHLGVTFGFTIWLFTRESRGLWKKYSPRLLDGLDLGTPVCFKGSWGHSCSFAYGISWVTPAFLPLGIILLLKLVALGMSTFTQSLEYTVLCHNTIILL